MLSIARMSVECCPVEICNIPICRLITQRIVDSLIDLDEINAARNSLKPAFSPPGSGGQPLTWATGSSVEPV